MIKRQTDSYGKAMKGSKGGAVVRALSSHQCGLARVRTYGICELSLLLVLSGYSGSPLFLKTNTFKFQFDLGTHGHVSAKVLRESTNYKLFLFMKKKSKGKNEKNI